MSSRESWAKQVQRPSLRRPGRTLFAQASRFAAIGVVNTCVDFSCFLVLIRYATSSLVCANVLSWMVAVTGSYVLNAFITFESERPLRLRPYAMFVAAGIAGLTSNTASLLVLATLMPVVIAKVLAIAVSFLVNFSLARFVVFRPPILVRE